MSKKSTIRSNGETAEQRMARYAKERPSSPLTDKQRAHVGDSLADQHAALVASQPVVPQVAVGPTRISQDELVDKINRFDFENDPSGTWRIDSTHTDLHLVRKDLDSARSRIARYAKKNGVDYSSQQLTDGDGVRHLVVILGAH